MKNIVNIVVVATLILAFTACSQTEFEPESGLVKGQKISSTISIADLKTNYMTNPDQFTADRITAPNQLVINGIVTTTDVEGNVYKYVAIQEETAGGEAIRVSIDAAGIASLLPVGQRVSVVLNGLCIGKYGESPQIGIYYVRPKDGRISPGAIPMPIARECIIPYGVAEPSAVVADTMTIAEILAATRAEMDYKLVCIKDVWFTGKGGYYNGKYETLTAAEKIFAPGTDGIGYPQSREIQDGTGSVVIATSEYAKFAQFPLPASTYKGNVTVIVSWYKSGSNGNYQLTLRTLRDLGSGFDEYLRSVNYID